MDDVIEIAESEEVLLQATRLLLVDVAGWMTADIYLGTRAPPSPHDGSLAWPLGLDGEALGVLVVHAHEPGAVTEDDVKLLRQIVRALARALCALRAREELRKLKADRAIDARAAQVKVEFLATLSHELRAPLHAVLGVSEALREGVYGSLDDRALQALRRIDDNGLHLLSLVNDILDVSKLEAGQIVLDRRPVSIDDVCSASLRMIQPAATKKALSVTLDVPARCDLLHADERRLVQVLVNLLSNAVKFTPHGGAIGLEVTEQEREIRFTVWDNGVGIAPESIPNLFQPFVQVDADLARRHRGSGLGLALVKRLVELHGGRVEVTSAPGEGSRFSVILAV